MGLLVELYPHQVVCRSWLLEKEGSQKGGLLNLSMGLGKTIVGFSMIDLNDNLPTLIFCPVGLLHQWRFECEDKTNLRCLIFHGKSRKTFANELVSQKPHIVLASFGSAKDDELKNRTWQRLIIDEIHYIRNIKTLLFKSLCQYEATYRIGLTGTPLVNGPFDLFSYCLFFKILDMPRLSNDKQLYQHLRKQFLFRLDRGLMRQVMFQMTLEDCSLDVALTAYHEQLHELQLEDVELGIYKRLEKSISKTASSTSSNHHMMLLSYIVYLRQSANDLYLVRSQLLSDPEYQEDMKPGEKTAKCIQLIHQVPATDKVIVFSEFLGMMNVVGKELHRLNIPHLFYVGEMTIQERSACIANFEKHQGKIILIAMKQCISVGLNLTQANHVIFLSEWWNFTLDRQCIARVYRIGQSKPVFVHKLMSKVTIDERIRQIATQKEQEIKEVSRIVPLGTDEEHADKYMRQTSLADYGFLLNMEEN